MREKESTISPVLCQTGVQLERIFLSTKISVKRQTDRKTDRCHVCFEILGLQLNTKNHKSSIFSHNKCKLVIKTEFPFGNTVVFSGSAGKHSA